MNVLITGADQDLGRLLNHALRAKHSVQAIRRDGCDHRDVKGLMALCQGVDAILHCDVFDPTDASEEGCLDWASRGTYVLMQAALSAGVERVVLASSLSLFDAYSDRFVVDETWQPKPDTEASSLAPYLAEMTCREFARQGGIHAINLRLGALGVVMGTSTEDAICAFEGALDLEFEPNGYRWQVFHVSSNPRFSTKQAERVLHIARKDR